jgi:hypothetical protein
MNQTEFVCVYPKRITTDLKNSKPLLELIKAKKQREQLFPSHFKTEIVWVKPAQCVFTTEIKKRDEFPKDITLEKQPGRLCRNLHIIHTEELHEHKRNSGCRNYFGLDIPFVSRTMNVRL